MITEHHFKGGKLSIRYEIGTASWHQQKAGHQAASVIVANHTFDEHVQFIENNKPDRVIAYVREKSN